MSRQLLFILFLFGSTLVSAQPTVGLISYDPSQAYEGYNLLYPHNQPNVYLLNNCGEIVHVWEDDAIFRPGNTAYLLPDGRLVKTKRLAAVSGNPIWAGGGGGIVEIRDWDNNLLWSFELNDSLYRLHHDIHPMPNGNILMIAWESHTLEELLDAGVDTSKLFNGKLWSDMIIEVDPELDSIVWEWHAWDHLIQDFDSTKANFGNVAAHPELIDLNYDADNDNPSWTHINAIDYDPVNDLILLSVPTFSEVWILDHTTTTAEAASHSGGFGGRGGDLLYRWGNPATYRAGTANDKTLFFQHDVHWLDDFVNPNHPYFGKVAAFNNRIGPNYSGGIIFTPPFDMYNFNFPMTGNVWGPETADWTFVYPGDSTKMHSTGLSSIQLLPNGNFLFCSGRQGYSFEVTPDDEIVWEYVTPLKGGIPVEQGTILNLNDNLTFRIKRYPADYSAFDGKNLQPKGWIEVNPDSTFCDKLLSTSDPMGKYLFKIFPNPANESLTLEWEPGKVIAVEIFDYLGRKKLHFDDLTGGKTHLSIADWLPGLYFVRIDGRTAARFLVTH